MPIAISITGQTHVTGLTNLREGAPNTKAPVRRKLPAGAVVSVEGLVVGESVQGNAHWYRVDATGYVWTGACEPLQTVAAPAAQPVVAAVVDPTLAKFHLDPTFAAKLSTLLQACRDQGLDFRVSQGLRTPAVQAQYYCSWNKRSPADIDKVIAKLKADGAPWTAELMRHYRDIPRIPSWRTNALPGAGWHQWGEAVDAYCYRNGVMVSNGGDPAYAAYAKAAEKLGLTAGLHFSQPDAGHVQLRKAGGATAIYTWAHIDDEMQARFGDKPLLDD
jgi:peptidoglycan L-alanyl-D-glutamate endopeptidase CwlK